MLTCCPHCGTDLTAFEPFSIGALGIEHNGAVIRWNGHRIHLTPCERLILLTIARAGGNPVKRTILAEATGYEGDDPENLIAVQITRIRANFRAIDPGFDRIENVHGVGLRWRIEDMPIGAAA